MSVREACRLSRELLVALMEKRPACPLLPSKSDRREWPREILWGEVEMDHDHPFSNERWTGNCTDLSKTGMGMTCDHYIDPGTPVSLTMHLDDMSVWTRAVVRYCQPVRGLFMTGLEFSFEDYEE